MTQSPDDAPRPDGAAYEQGTPEGEQAAPPPEASADGPLDDAAATPGDKPDQPAAGQQQDEQPDAQPDEQGEEAEIEDDLTLARRDLEGLTGDLKRLQAEYLNYKRRVERDRDLVRENATYAALVPIVEVLDTIDRAREHGDLDPGFAAVADQLERVVAKQGLTRFGEPGDAFDPTLHEALSHVGTDPDVEVTTCKIIAKSGYRIGERVVRAAQVLVVDPAEE